MTENITHVTKLFGIWDITNLVNQVNNIDLGLGLLTIWFLTFITLSISLFIRIIRQFNQENLDKTTFWMLIIIFLYGMLPFILNDYVL